MCPGHRKWRPHVNTNKKTSSVLTGSHITRRSCVGHQGSKSHQRSCPSLNLRNHSNDKHGNICPSADEKWWHKCYGSSEALSKLRSIPHTPLSTHRSVLFSDLIRDVWTEDSGNSETQPVKVKRITVGGVLTHKQDICIPPLPKTQRPSWKT